MRVVGCLRTGLLATIFGLGFAAGYSTAYALDPASTTRSPEAAAAPSPGDAFRNGTRLFYEGDKKAAIEQLRRAAESGHPIAQWKLGRIYQMGDGVPANDVKAFEYYNQVANSHADDAPGSPEAAFVASAFVALGSYYLNGIKDTAVKPNVDKARDIFTYAASYFGDPDAQYNLGRLYLESAHERDPKQAARWLRLAARKGHSAAQALLGQLLFVGDDDVPRRSVQGLMWLTIARQTAPQGRGDEWIREAQEQAFSVASEPERRQAVTLAQEWIAKSGSP